MRFLLVIALFSFQTLYASGPIPSFFDGIETAKKITDRRSKAAQFDLACQDYYGVLKATPRLSKDDESEILAGYFAITNYFCKQKNQAAIKEYEILTGKPSQAQYQSLLKRLKAGGALFEPIFKRNLGLSILSLLEKTREESRQNLLVYKQKDEESGAEAQNVEIAANLEAKTTEAAHRIMSGSFGGTRIASTSEKQVMTSFLLDAVQRVIDRKEDLSGLLKNYDIKYAQDQHDKGKLTKHISICRTLLASVHYLLNNKVRVLNKKAKGDIKALLGQTWDSALVEKVVFSPQVLEFLKDSLGSFSLEKEKPAPTYTAMSTVNTTVSTAISKEEMLKRMAIPSHQQDAIDALEALDPRHYKAAIDLTSDLAYWQKGEMITALSLANQELSDAFLDTVLKLTNGDRYNRKEFIEALLPLDPRHYKSVLRLTKELDSNKFGIIKALQSVDPKHSDLFSDAAAVLITGVDPYWIEEKILTPLSLLDPRHYKAAIDLTSGLDYWKKKDVIIALSLANQELSDAFPDTVLKLTNGDSYNRKEFIEALLPLDPRHYKSVLRLTKELDSNKFGIIKALQSVDPKHSDLFSDAAAVLITGVDAYYAEEILTTFSSLNPAHYKTAAGLTRGMSVWDKISAIKTLSMVKPKYIRIFLKVGQRLTAGMDILNKIRVIRSFSLVPIERLFAINTDCTPERFQNLQRYLTSSDRSYLFDRLAQIESSTQRIAEMNTSIQQCMARVQQPVIPPSEIHNYSNTTVVTDNKKEANPLNTEIIIQLRKKLTGKSLSPYKASIKAVSDLIDKKAREPKSELNKEDALMAIKVGEGYDDHEEAFRLSYTFMKNNYPLKLDQWLSTFLDESLNAYAKGRSSCEKGMMERAITSLRGIDTDLDRLFNQAEGPMLAKLFMKNNLNIFDPTKAKNIAAGLKKRGITSRSTPKAAAQAFRNYINESLASFGDISQYKDEIDAIVDSMEDNFEEMFAECLK